MWYMILTGFRGPIELRCRDRAHDLNASLVTTLGAFVQIF